MSTTTVVPGFIISAVTGGGAASKGNATPVGRVSWYATGHAYLTQTGQAAIYSQLSTYVAARTGIFGADVEQGWSGTAGHYHCLNGDQAAQVALLVTLFQTAANITGPTS